MHRQGVAGHHQGASGNDCRKVPHRVLAAAIDQRDARARNQALMALAFLRAAEKDKLRVVPPCQPFGQLQVALLAPLLELPAASCSSIQAYDGARPIDAEALDVLAAARQFLLA